MTKVSRVPVKPRLLVYELDLPPDVGERFAHFCRLTNRSSALVLESFVRGLAATPDQIDFDNRLRVVLEVLRSEDFYKEIASTREGVMADFSEAINLLARLYAPDREFFLRLLRRFAGR